MIDKSRMRSEIETFFKENKLNKNSYHKKWFTGKSADHIYDYILCYYPKDHPLYNIPLGQKLYHIIHNIDSIPSNKFISFSRGYTKDKVTFSGKSINHFIERLSKITPQTDILSEEETIRLLQHHIKQSSYTSLLKNTLLVNSIFYYTADIVDLKYKILYLCNNKNIVCRCGRLRRPITGSTSRLLSTCGDIICSKSTLSEAAKERDLKYLQSEEIKIKRVVSRTSHYKHSPETKEKIRQTNKKTWKERKYIQSEINRRNGVYERQSIKMKKMIERGEFTPNTNNRFNKNKIASEITGVNNYRSRWERYFHEKNPHLEYEKTRIPYYHENKEHIYIVDFTDHISKTLYEVKPNSFINESRNQSKFSAAREWCNSNGYIFKLITENNIHE
jgi:hypothetical protein